MSLGKTIESLIDAGMTPNEAIRSAGGQCSGRPLGDDFVSGWAMHPMVGEKVHWWQRKGRRDDIPPRLDERITSVVESACDLFSVETAQVMLLAPGNVDRCKKCERATIP